MNYRNLGETGMRVSEISLGTWAFGSEWGEVSDEASGLLSGKMTVERVFPADDHRSFNREGETFSGVPFERGLEAAGELKELVPEGYTLAHLALRWILMHPAVSCAIPGAKRKDQVESNVVAAAEMSPLSDETMDRIRGIYDADIRQDPAVSVAIPGAKTPAQVEANAAASTRPLLSGEDLRLVREAAPLRGGRG